MSSVIFRLSRLALAAAIAVLIFISIFSLQCTQASTVKAGLSSPTGIVADSDGTLWITDTGEASVKHIDQQGNLLFSFGRTGNDPGDFHGPRFLALDPSDNIWVTDTFKVQKFDKNGKFILALDLKNDPSYLNAKPLGVAVDKSGNLWIPVQALNSGCPVQQFNPQGAFVRQVNTCSNTNYTSIAMGGVAVTDKGEAWIVTSEGRVEQNLPAKIRLQKFDIQGNYLGEVDQAYMGLRPEPRQIAVAFDGSIWIAKLLSGEVQKLNAQGHPILTIKTWGNDKSFLAPNGIAVDSSGNLWVVDSGNRRIVEFSSKGEFLFEFGP